MRSLSVTVIYKGEIKLQLKYPNNTKKNDMRNSNQSATEYNRLSSHAGRFGCDSKSIKQYQ